MEIEVAPGNTNQRPQNINQIRIMNNKNQKGSYQILPDGMDIEIEANTNVTNNLVSNSTAFKNTGGVTLVIKWL